MGIFVVACSIAIVVIQATSMLLGRSAHNWSFYLLESTPDTAVLTEFQNLMQNIVDINPITTSNDPAHQIGDFLYKNISYKNRSDVISLHIANVSDSVLSQVLCLEEIWKYSTPSGIIPSFCIFNKHSPESIYPVLEPWNPHLILLTICCIHSIICISKTHVIPQNYVNFPKNQEENAPPKHMKIPIGYAVGVSFLLIFIIAVLEGIKNTDLVQYPTIILVVMLLLSSLLYVRGFEARGHDIIWSIATHLQLVGVPLAVLAISTLGARMWTDVLAHLEILNAAVYCLWLQSNTKNPTGQRICHLLTILLPSLSLYLAHIQWGKNDNWRYVIGSMACGALAPLFIITIFFHVNSNADHRGSEKMFYKISTLCGSAALLSFVVNLALF
jgi:hypothetical protein